MRKPPAVMRWQRPLEREYAAKLAPHVGEFHLFKDSDGATLEFKFPQAQAKAGAHVHNLLNDWLSVAGLDDDGGRRSDSHAAIYEIEGERFSDRADPNFATDAWFNLGANTPRGDAAVRRLHAELVKAKYGPWHQRVTNWVATRRLSRWVARRFPGAPKTP